MGRRVFESGSILIPAIISAASGRNGNYFDVGTSVYGILFASRFTFKSITL